MSGGRATRLLAAVGGVAAVLAVWLVGTPPNGTPDEAAHLVRGMSAAEGQWVGTDAARFYGERNLSADVGRSFTLPARLDAEDTAPCDHGRPYRTTSGCGPPFVVDPHHGPAHSHVGAYFPPAYVPLGLAELTAPDPAAADYRGRAVSAAWCLALLGLAFACTRSRRERIAWLAGFLPITAFVATAAATNGVEVCGALALAAGGLAVRGARGPAGPWAVVAGGTSLAVAKAGGPFFLAVEAVLLTLASGGVGWVPRLGRWRVGAWLLPVLGAVANLAWSASYGRNPVTYARPPLRSSSLHAEVWHQVARLPWQLFTQFGWADTYLPRWAVVLGYVCTAVALGVLALSGGPRGVMVVALGLAAALAAGLGLAVVEIRGGYGLQGRYVVAALVPLPLLACLAGERARLSRRLPRPARIAAGLLLGAAGLGLVGGHAISALTVLRRNMVGGHGSWLLHDAGWTPPGGSDLLLALLAAGLLLLTGAVLAGRDPGPAASVDRPAPG